MGMKRMGYRAVDLSVSTMGAEIRLPVPARTAAAILPSRRGTVVLETRCRAPSCADCARPFWLLKVRLCNYVSSRDTNDPTFRSPTRNAIMTTGTLTLGTREYQRRCLGGMREGSLRTYPR